MGGQQKHGGSERQWNLFGLAFHMLEQLFFELLTTDQVVLVLSLQCDAAVFLLHLEGMTRSQRLFTQLSTKSPACGPRFGTFSRIGCDYERSLWMCG